MLSFATPLASQIGFSIASLNKNNYKSIELELSQVIFTMLMSHTVSSFQCYIRELERFNYADVVTPDMIVFDFVIEC